MTSLKSTRLKKRRQNSDEIEDSRPTQSNGHLDDVSEEEIKKPHAKQRARVKQEKKGKGKQRAVDVEDEAAEGDIDIDMDNESDEDNIIDVADFPDQPLRKDHLPKLKGIAQDWDSMRKQINQRCDIYKDVAAAMAEAGEVDIQNSKTLKILDAGIKEFIDVDLEMMAHSGALDKIHQKIARGELVNNVIEQYGDLLKEQVDEYAAKTARQKYSKDDRYVEFHAGIWEVRHPDDAMPPITQFIDKESGDDSDSEDDIEMGGATQKYLCPLTLTPFVNPLTSNVCGHSFSRDALREYFKDGRLSKCPLTGCNKSFRLSDCVADEALAKKVKARQRRQRVVESDSEDDGVVD